MGFPLLIFKGEIIIKNIAISGKMTAGKTTASDYIIQKYGYKRESFAAPIKVFGKSFAKYNLKKSAIEFKNDGYIEMYHLLAYLTEYNSIDTKRALDSLLENELKPFSSIKNVEIKNNKVRELYQTIGQKFRENFNENIWVDAAIKNIGKNKSIIDDLRYINEAEALKQNDFILIRLNIDKETQQKRLLQLYGKIDEEKLIHSSEIDLDNYKFDYYLDATEPLETMFQKIDEIMVKINV